VLLVGLFVERGLLLELERVDDIVRLLGGILETLLGLLGRSVGTNVYSIILLGYLL
jgi:hypothetical protein